MLLPETLRGNKHNLPTNTQIRIERLILTMKKKNLKKKVVSPMNSLSNLQSMSDLTLLILNPAMNLSSRILKDLFGLNLLLKIHAKLAQLHFSYTLHQPP